jgi:AcrR family transcriptional regulator
MPSRTKPPTKRTKTAYHHGDLRRALLDASIALIAEHGVEALSLREVARAAGVSPAAPYHHFASKSELLGALAASGFAGLTTAMERALADLSDSDSPIDRLEALGTAYIEFACAHPTEFRLMFRPGLVAASDLPPDCDPSSAFALLLDAVGRVSGVLPAGTVAPEALTLTAWSAVHGAAELLLEGPLGQGDPHFRVKPRDVGPLVVRSFTQLLRTAVKASPVAKRKR